jgi:DNA polymerase-3 subunit delta'
MSWQNILGHDPIVEGFRRAVARGRLASTFLFVGPPGVGKRTFAIKLAQTLLCSERAVDHFEACGQCDSCRQAELGTHPDLHLVQKLADKSGLILEQFIGDRETRSKAGLCHDIAMKPHRGNRRVAIIDDADTLGAETANCLLKTLEEPPPRSVMILIGTSAAKQLPTIRSRCQIVRFQPLEAEDVSRLLQEKGLVADAQEAQRLARLSDGSLQQALEMADASLEEFRAWLFERLSDLPRGRLDLATQIEAFVNEAGKAAPARRARTRQVVLLAERHFRQMIPGLGTQSSEPTVHAGQSLEAYVECLDRCLEALTQIERNANQSTLIQAWIDDLGEALLMGEPARG